MQKKQILGCVADDFTGASDAASFLQKAGMRTLLINEIQEKVLIPMNTDAIVIALKSRTQETELAVRDTLQAIKWLEKKGATKFYFKYCSTFDSTRKGNIGPVADAIMEYLHQQYTILCPALPVNGRIVKDGRLYVNGVLLDESPMRNHPLTPMWDSRIKNLIESQSRYCAVEFYRDKLGLSEEECLKWIKKQGTDQDYFYIIPDYVDDSDSENIVRLFGKLQFLTGGSGILASLAKAMLEEACDDTKMISAPEIHNHKPGVVFAGSCSAATLGQIDDYQERGGLSYHIDPIALYEGRQSREEILDFILHNQQQEVLIYSSDKEENVKEVQRLGRERIAELIERTISGLAAELVKYGYGRIIVAGGETSGAVTKALGFSAFQIGEFPGGMMVIPLIIGCLVNTFIPQCLEIGGFTTALFKSGQATLVGLFIFCSGATINVRQVGQPLYKGAVLTILTLVIGVVIGYLLNMAFGPAGVLGLTPFAVISAVTNSNGAIYTALAKEFGDETDMGAIAVLSLNDGPFLTMIALGTTGLASIPVIDIVAAIIPLIIGMILGNLDADFRELLSKGLNMILPVNGFVFGANISLITILNAGVPGILLGLITVFCTGILTYIIYSAIRRKPDPMGMAIGTVGGNAVATPASVAMSDPSLEPYVESATAQTAAAVVITAILTPLLTGFVSRMIDKKNDKKESASGT